MNLYFFTPTTNVSLHCRYWKILVNWPDSTSDLFLTLMSSVYVVSQSQVISFLFLTFSLLQDDWKKLRILIYKHFLNLCLVLKLYFCRQKKLELLLNSSLSRLTLSGAVSRRRFLSLRGGIRQERDDWRDLRDQGPLVQGCHLRVAHQEADDEDS